MSDEVKDGVNARCLCSVNPTTGSRGISGAESHLPRRREGENLCNNLTSYYCEALEAFIQPPGEIIPFYLCGPTVPPFTPGTTGNALENAEESSGMGAHFDEVLKASRERSVNGGGRLPNVQISLILLPEQNYGFSDAGRKS